MNEKNQSHHRNDEFAGEIVEAESVCETIPHNPMGTDSQRPTVGLAERILSPQNLNRMMGSGGGLLVIGFAIWLWSIGVFANPLFVATTVGAVNLLLLGVGVWLYQATRYQLAGRGLTLLGSLVLPLNLWLYDSQGLISLSNGEPLWVPALICCAIYAAVARITRDSLFVHTLVGGFVLTGMLFLAGTPESLLWSALPISTFLALTGGACVVADRLFREATGAFSRDQFGLAFFRAGRITLLASLAVLLAAQVAHASPIILPLSPGVSRSAVLLSQAGQLWSMAILVGAAGVFLGVCFTHRGTMLDKAMFGISGIWSLAIALQLLHIEVTIELSLLLLAAMAIATNATNTLMHWRTDDSLTRNPHHAFGATNERIALAVFAAVLMFAGLGRYFIGVVVEKHLFDGWMEVCQLLAASVALLTIPGIWKSDRNAGACGGVLGLASVGMTTTLATAMFGCSAFSGPLALCLVAAVALAFVLGTLRQTGAAADRCGWIVNSSALAVLGFWLMLLFSLPAEFAFGVPAGIALMAILAISCSLSSLGNGGRFGLTLGGVSFAMAIVQTYVWLGLTGPYSVIISVTFGGLVLLSLGKWIPRLISDTGVSIGLPMERIANSAILFGTTASILFAASSVAGPGAQAAHLWLLVLHLVASGVALAAAQDRAWRSGFVASGLATAATGIVVLSTISQLTLFQRIEGASLALGLVMVVAGYLGWSRENGKSENAVSLNFFFGSLLLIVPMICGVWFDRLSGGMGGDAWICLHETGGLAVGLALLGSGILCHVRSTTLAGAVLLIAHVSSNLLLIRFPEQLHNTSVILMIGGAAFFSIALLLSIHRDWLIRLPAKIHSGKGVFRVLKWR